MKALVLTTATRSVRVADRPIPTPASGEVLIRVEAIALNPVDSLYVAEPVARQPERIIGTDFAGVVVGLARDLEDAQVQDKRPVVGARVAGFLQGAGSTNDRPGAFAEYITARYDLLWTVPAAMSLEDAASVSMCGLTAAQGVFYRLGLPAPFWPAKSKPDTEVHAGAEAERHPTPSSPIRPETSSLPNVVNVLIYGASTSLGMYAAQLVRLAERHLPPGTQMRVIGAARTDKHPFLRAPPYRYDELVDYRDDNWPAEVRAATGGAGVQYALDTISEGETVSKVESTFADSDTGTRRFAVFRGPAGGRYDPSGMRVKPIYGAAWEGLGVEIGYNDGVLPASASAREFAARFFAYLGTAADDGEIKLVPNPVRIMPGGLERVVPDGFALLGGIQVSDRKTTSRAEQYMRPISAEKIVYSLVR